MLVVNDSNLETLPCPSLAEILSILSQEYEEDLTNLGSDPHQWLIVNDAATGIMGGMCLTPRVSKPKHPMLADFCHNLKSMKGWVASHLFCWIPDTLEEENNPKLQKAIAAFYEHLYAKLNEFCVRIGIEHIWLISSLTQHLTATGIGLWPFRQEMPFQHHGSEYVAAFLPCTDQAYVMLRENQMAYYTSVYRLN
jgi:hypothetical protein